MEQLGTALTILGATIALLQSVLVVISTRFRRNRLRRDRALSQITSDELDRIESQIAAQWGKDAATIDNFESTSDYRPDTELDALRSKLRHLKEERVSAGWFYTYSHLENELTPKAQELKELEDDWRRLWWNAIPGIVGAIMALAGAILLSFVPTN